MIHQIPWIQRSFQFNFPVQLFPVIFSRLEGAIFRLNSILQNADENECCKRTSGWSVKEHLGHLSDLEELWWKRLNDFLEHKEVLTAADITNKKTTEARHNEKSLPLLLKMFALERQKILENIYGFDEQILQLRSIHPRLQQEMRLIDSLYFVAEHDDHHIAAISGLLRTPNPVSKDIIGE